MDFLNNIPTDQKDEILSVLQDDVLNADEKFSYIKDMTTDTKLLMKILKYLEEQPEERSPSPDDFLGLVSEQKKKLMSIMLNRGDLATLEKLIAREDEEVKDAYEKWKKGGGNITPISRSNTACSLDKYDNFPRKYEENPYYTYSRNGSETKDFDSLTVESLKMIDEDVSTADEAVEEEEDNYEDETVNNAPQLEQDFFDKLPDCLNILILGETGVGKSTFINGLINYLKYGTIHDALENGVEILIKTYFTHTDEDYNRMRIECDPTVEVERGAEQENENTVDGQSSTQAPKSYVFSWGPKGSQKAIRIIDTPGVGDVRGIDQEKLNFAKILSFIADFSEIHAICVLLKPNESKLTLTFRYCINELLSHLHVSASKNILFCFTNARQTLYRPGDTLPTLDSHLQDLRRKRGIDIPLNSSTMFCFDNESFRFLCALREGAHFEEKDIKNFNSSWQKTVEETFRMFKRIAQLPVHNVNDTLSVNNIRGVILALARPLAEIARNQLINVKLIEDKLREVDDYMKMGKDLEGRLYVDQVKMFAKEIDYPITVCTGKECVEYMRFNTDPESPMEVIYKTECHPHCYLEGVQTSICPNPALQHCQALAGNIDQCSRCNCPWTTHMHIRYKLEKTMEKTVDKTVEDSIKNRDDQIRTAQIFIDKETKRKEDLQKEADKISKSCVEFAAFLRQNSIIPYNDVYKEYVEHLIKEEKDKVSMGGSDKLLQQLQKYRDEYEQQVNILESHGKTSKSNKTIKQIYGMVDELKRMKNCGDVLKEIQKLEMLSVRDQQITKVTSVDLNTGWLGRAVVNGYAAVKNAMGGGKKKETAGKKGWRK